MTDLPHKNPKNAARQLAAFEIVQRYANLKDNRPNLEADLEGYITDLLVDLRHLCGARGIDFDNRARISADHYAAELAGE